MNMRTDLIKFAVCNIDQEKIAKYADKTGRKVVSFNIDELDEDGKPIIEVVISNRDKVGEIRKEDFEIFRKTIPVAKDALIRIIEDTDVEVEDPGEGEPAVLDKVYAQKIGFSVLTVAILISCIKTALTVYPMAIFPGLALAALLIYVAFGNDLRNAKTGHSYLLTGRYKNDF